MKVTMFWHGGSGYSCFDVHDKSHAEVFDSLRDAKRAFESRLHDSYYPCVCEETPEDGGAEAWVFFGPAKDHPIVGQEYPDRDMRFGPRRVVVIERV